ncbi:MAG: hypothetical protein A2V81_05300 [Candidatus Abawacabacteria bacterium RBG_16_42_10]|uniref:Phosphatidate cytidylyltransferase n=1 Tax=Candidatus Abawacabacteria bacterium RBG_16_42_10 TaxID=1817814 RepID=A0A1F4XKN3_9BACT|nr:MAG: hypothetical protein A2V81_05300 [Candidatus Abawacabacteria bacterium RBG_16_42_10]
MVHFLSDCTYQKELIRKAIHITLGVVTCVLIFYNIIEPFYLFIVLAITIVFSFFSRKKRLPIIGWFLEHFDRPEHFPAKGFITYLIGVILSLELFPLPFALAAIMVLALGDGVAALARPFSKRKTALSNKHLIEETIAGIVAGAIGAAFFVSLPLAIIASSCAMLLEAIEVRFNNEILDDNILIPLAAGTSLLLLTKFGVFV